MACSSKRTRARACKYKFDTSTSPKGLRGREGERARRRGGGARDLFIMSFVLVFLAVWVPLLGRFNVCRLELPCPVHTDIQTEPAHTDIQTQRISR